MIDKDGIERPDDSSAHTFEMPHRKNFKLSYPKLISNNIFKRFFGYLFRIVVWAILSAFFYLKYRLKTEGKQNLKKLKGKPLIAVCNHCHFIDAGFIAVKFMPRMVWVTSIPENFAIPLAGGLVRVLGGIPIAYDLKGTKMFKKVIDDCISKNRAIVFYPEASLWKNYRSLRPFKSGGFRFSVRSNCAILPMTVTIQIIHKSLKRNAYRIKLHYLEPVYPEPAQTEGETTRQLIEKVHKQMKAVIEASCHDDIYTRKYKRQVKKHKKLQKNS